MKLCLLEEGETELQEHWRRKHFQSDISVGRTVNYALVTTSDSQNSLQIWNSSKTYAMKNSEQELKIMMIIKCLSNF